MRLNKLTFIILSLVGLSLASCERKYDAPLLTEPSVEVGKEGMLTIAEYKNKFYKTPEKEGRLIEEDFAIRAVVVGNDVSGNIYKQIYVQDATGGISIGIDQNNIGNDYQVGQEVFIKLQGLAATSYGGQVQIGMQKTQSNRIPYEIVKKHILKDKWPNLEKAQPKVTTIGELNDAMVGTLIKLENVYFVLGGEKPFADQAFNNINRELKDPKGNMLYVRNSKYATFANDIMPKGNGTVVGILSKFNNDYQLFIRTSDDCYGFTGKDPEINGGDTPTPPTPPTGSVIYSEIFDKGFGKMTTQDVSGAQSWKINATYKNVSMAGFDGTKSQANEDWLISPVFDLSVAKSMSIAFQHTINKGDASKMKEEQTLWITDNFTGDVKTTTWTALTIPTYPTGSDWKYVPSGDIQIPATLLGKGKVVFAFKYTCTDAASGNWQIKELKVTSDGGKLADGSTPTPTPDPKPDPKPEPDPQPTPAGLLFPGADFEDWTAFTGSLNTFGIKDYATQADGGRSGKALNIKGTPKGNDFVFTVVAKETSPKTGNTITLYVKGKSGKSLSFNVFGDGGVKKVFNLGEVSNSSDVKLEVAENNQYTGAVDTKGQWLKVSLNIAGLKLATSGNLFALKVGKEVAYDILVDDITIE